MRSWAREPSKRGTSGWGLRRVRQVQLPTQCLNPGSMRTLPIKISPLWCVCPQRWNQDCGEKGTHSGKLAPLSKRTHGPSLCALHSTYSEHSFPLTTLLLCSLGKLLFSPQNPAWPQLLQNGLSGPPTRSSFPLQCHTSPSLPTQAEPQTVTTTATPVSAPSPRLPPLCPGSDRG